MEFQYGRGKFSIGAFGSTKLSCSSLGRNLIFLTFMIEKLQSTLKKMMYLARNLRFFEILIRILKF